MIVPTAPVAPTTATLMRANSPNGCSGRIVSGPDSSNAACSERTACLSWSPAMTHEILIGDVEIISMLMPSSPSVAKTFAATPGCDFIPAPTIETLPIVSSATTSSMPTSATSGSSAARAVRRSSRGTVNEISARAPSPTGSFWMIMSTLTFASASARRCARRCRGGRARPAA